ncbi:MAG: Usg family protein [Micavibrio sp.]
MADFERQFTDHYRLTTAQIYYHLPDYPKFLQEFIWQDYDLAPKFPALRGFLDFWVEEIEGRLHSVYVAHHKIITDAEARFIEFDVTVQ